MKKGILVILISLFTAIGVSETAVIDDVEWIYTLANEKSKQRRLETDEVFTVDEMKTLILGASVIQMKNGKAIVGISLNKATTLNGDWQKVEDIEVEVTPDVNENATFYQFVVPER